MDTNWIAVLVSAVFAMVLGFIWYSKALFEKQWLKLSGITKEKMEKDKDKLPMIFGAQFVGAVIEVWVLSMFIDFAGVNDLVTGSIVGLRACGGR